MKIILRGGDDPCLSSTRQGRTVVMKRDSDTVASALDVASPITPVIALQICDFQFISAECFKIRHGQCLSGRGLRTEYVDACLTSLVHPSYS